MFERLEELLRRYRELNEWLSSSEATEDMELFRKKTKEYSDLTETAETYEKYLRISAETEKAKVSFEEEEDGELKELFREEIAEKERELKELTGELKILLLPKDKNDERDCILELRAGAGGEEAALFASLLAKMYTAFCASHRLSIETVDESKTELGGLKEGVYNVHGKGAYKYLKYESGVHRVQRVPETETQGRIHTSTATVAVLPEAEEVEVEIAEKDIRIDIFHSGGAGGQNVNKVASAVRITHFPTGIVVTCQDERSQLKNKERAFSVLRSRIYDYYNGKSTKERDENRKSLVGTGDRSERIRTYNFPQNRITDHRINVSQYNLDSFVLGNMDSMIEALALADRERMLEG